MLTARKGRRSGLWLHRLHLGLLPRCVSSLKTVLSNSGTIAPRLKVPRSPPLAALGQVENSYARRPARHVI